MIHSKRLENRFVAGLRSIVPALLTFMCLGLCHAAPPPAEQVLIDRLIDGLANQQDAKFLRNGTAYSGADAARFLRGKLDSLGLKVSTADQFIEQMATRSSSTGVPHTIRFADGRQMPAGQFLKQELLRLDAAK